MGAVERRHIKGAFRVLVDGVVIGHFKKVYSPYKSKLGRAVYKAGDSNVEVAHSATNVEWTHPVLTDGVSDNTYLEDWYDRVKGKGGLLSAAFGLHASLTLSDETLARAVDMALGLDVGFHIHVAEAVGSAESAPRISCCQRDHAVAEQAQLA
jgi:cytosine/adenosine deaminase-related metal-dependent hydrolase